MELIDADRFYLELKERCDAALKWYKEETDEENKTKAGVAVITFCEVKLTLDKQPTVDAVPVVRCKDCKYFLPDDKGCDLFYSVKDGFYSVTDEDDYCSSGVRKDGQ